VNCRCWDWPNDQWHTANSTVISQRGSWVRLAYSPSGYSGAAKQVGVQLSASPTNTSTTVYLNSITWAR
jgi:hypothetical protein